MKIKDKYKKGFISFDRSIFHEGLKQKKSNQITNKLTIPLHFTIPIFLMHLSKWVTHSFMHLIFLHHVCSRIIPPTIQ